MPPPLPLLNEALSIHTQLHNIPCTSDNYCVARSHLYMPGCIEIYTLPTTGSVNMSEEGDIDVESAEDVPDIAVEATATTVDDRSEVYSPTVSYVMALCVCLYTLANVWVHM